MKLKKKNPLTPLLSTLSKIPFLTIGLLVLPFALPPFIEMIVSPLLTLAQPTLTSGEDPRGESLYQQLIHSKQEVARLEKLLEEFGRFREIESAPEGTLARNLGQSPRLFHHGLVLDQGLQEGISIGSLVTHTGSLIGLVDEVKNHWCHVQLISDPNFSISCHIVSADERAVPSEGWIRALCGGRFSKEGDFPLEVRFVPKARAADCQVGDVLVTSGHDFKAPSGYLIGTITKISENSDNLFLTIAGAPHKDPSSLPLFTVHPPPVNPFNKDASP